MLNCYKCSSDMMLDKLSNLVKSQLKAGPNLLQVNRFRTAMFFRHGAFRTEQDISVSSAAVLVEETV
jgi:hypothetical protein